MNKLSDILNKVTRILENSDKDIRKQIYNISNILEIDEKTATVLHFVNKDSHWNPTTLPMLEDVMEKLSLKEQTLDQSIEKRKEIKDFYLVNYLDRYWKEPLTKKINQMKDLHYMSHWLGATISEMISDVEKLGLYPEIDFKRNPEKGQVEYEDFRQILGDDNTFIYKPVAEWIETTVNQTKNQTLSEPV
tara:strand:- start:176 stop:745 length:570 start_codon:yes stop_codon:yes gene_type:complete